MPPSIGESSGIPNTKNLSGRVEIGFIPLFTGQVFFGPEGLHCRDSREGPEPEVWHARAAMVAAARKRQGEGDSIRFLSLCRAS